MSEQSPAIAVVYNGDGFDIVQRGRWQKDADGYFVIGERYLIQEVGERSSNSHRHYFACVNEAWKNLPDDLLRLYPSAEHLRKHALIRTGFADIQDTIFGSKQDAERAAALIRPLDGYAIIETRGPVVTIYRAKSQRRRAMDKDEFQRSKDAVLDWISKLLGTNPEALSRNVMEAA